MTLHAAKGLEFPVVFVSALEEGLLPHTRANTDDKQLEEERRLLFVGITRASREFYLSRCPIRTFRGQQQATLPSRFLEELPAEQIEYHDLSGVELPRSVGGHGAGGWPLTGPESLRVHGLLRPIPADYGGRAGGGYGGRRIRFAKPLGTGES